MLSAEEIVGQPNLLDVIKAQSYAFLGVNLQNPRLASVFATQQRWLLAHLGLALHFTKADADGSLEGGLTAARFVREVVAGGVASRNTATAFLQEMQHYGIIAVADRQSDRRMRLLAPSQTTIDAITLWVRIHLHTLDMLDGGARVDRLDACPDAVACLQPRIARALVASTEIREPGDPLAHFMWINDGFLMVERIFVTLVEQSSDGMRHVTNMSSMAEIASGLNLSGAHAGKKLRQAERAGILGRQVDDGRTRIWVSSALIDAVLRVQAAKLSIIDEAFNAVYGQAEN